jgi:hypothetical protein
MPGTRDNRRARGSGENRISLRPRHRETSRISYGIKIGEVRIWPPTPAMIIVGVTASPPVMQTWGLLQK